MRALDQAALEGIARLAGRQIMAVREAGFAVEEKADHSPLTTADLRSSRTIMDGLADAFPGLPVIGEETAKAPYAERRGWTRCFVVDPLDGTKEFVRGSEEFCVCIALVERSRPVFGVVYVPARDALYSGGPGIGARRRLGEGKAEPIQARPPRPGETLTVLTSVSHPDPGLDAFLTGLPAYRPLAMGSAVKFCVLAEGGAHLYPRRNPTWEWDTAAGHALVLGAGGNMTAFSGAPFDYNKPDLQNGPFLATSWPGREPYPGWRLPA